ncbi:MAG: serine hydrolase [bacterium]|nr:serine hydrolase [bacterium]
MPFTIVINHKFIFSILTAMAVGASIAFAGIEGVKMLVKKNMAEAISSVEVSSEEDPTFISHFSRAFIYSSGKEKVSISDLPGDVMRGVQTAISAISYSVIDIDQDIVIMEKDPERLLPIASVTKLVTAAVARNLIDEDQLITITAAAIATEGDTGRLRLDERLKVKELLYPLLMVSSNDAAEALARHYDSIHGKGKFVKEMNNWANSIGAYRTYFRDPSGISPNNLSTANDISIIAKWIRDNEPDLFDITLTKAKSIRSHTWINPTHFLNLSEYQGGKNGYTPEANRTSISLFALGFPKRIYSIVLLGSKQRDADTLIMLNDIHE